MRTLNSIYLILVLMSVGDFLAMDNVNSLYVIVIGMVMLSAIKAWDALRG